MRPPAPSSPILAASAYGPLRLPSTTSGGERLRGYVGLFDQILRHNGRLCLGLMLTVEHNSVPDEVMNEVRWLVDQHTAWLALPGIWGGRI
jgi:hypothetical protein